MALNTLGELETAPGASRRELAHSHREVAASSAKLSGGYAYEANLNFHNADVYDQRWRASRLLPEKALKVSAGEWALAKQEALKQGYEAAAEAAHYAEQARIRRKLAFRNAVIATVQTITAKVNPVRALKRLGSVFRSATP